ncbi:hypothetical protein A2422_00425 [Candidatus Woesebacteria bacterium RIFOXYC1_FULL_31_51]|uniref:Uncharacterized protein n=1 Tax=Candidatus Woesebacteria bacterium GW2011_GWC2_31_9 TaxID=1618586 RepID=A0A0G0AYJ9_9BACT|nr:MAG: hypothetical protein UR17_C0001G0396 [Candidatus Woesebacteria bacterium GW2011_GWF1_31_35]KKP23115.1 MAG: hypothetical protein UR11_C0001G0089 [Candidatus Woesebacteria bacterium GW2011_GWC1_30_29]KKP26803.1 MAG: hypothetical protein UR13_C0002G0038 [Candidatus Woesebacteria bacterium GW2011_GWD1_31_12]KKP27378.1 MAG: hypothetical protein UR16_C0003G0038 [Candidatus Woesebacteria bacterium GW2011_GWB1_31_29]KKP31595.1 MAG: hypothetical protein UR21_C0007G0012 [Candidatus Woesebacteria 
MTPQDPQFLYMILVLPSLFGLTLMGEGIYKCIHEEWSGLISIFFGLAFIAMVVFAYFFFSSYMANRGV